MPFVRSWPVRPFGVALLTAACASPSAPRIALPSPPAAASRAEPGRAVADVMDARSRKRGHEPLRWQPATTSPQPFQVAGPRGCDQPDAALTRIASRLARRQARGDTELELFDIVYAMRAEGAPYVWPRALSLEAEDLPEAELWGRLDRWLDDMPTPGVVRCGLADARSTSGATVVAAVAVRSLCDLDPVPTRVRSGDWITLRARPLVEVTDGKWIVLPPDRPPFAVPTTAGAHISGRFRADRRGPWMAQLLVDAGYGPRPAAELMVFADLPPPAHIDERPAPGEESLRSTADDRVALAIMVNGARRRAGLSALFRDPQLDELAQHHAEAMARTGRVGHDVGGGDPRLRLEAAGLLPLAAGENVARATTSVRVHRALWASPSHRGNLLEPRFEALGVGAVRDASGSVWAVELFADFQ